MKTIFPRIIPAVLIGLVIFGVGVYAGVTLVTGGGDYIAVRRNLACDDGKSIAALPVGNNGVAVVLSDGRTFDLQQVPGDVGHYVNYDLYNDPEFFWRGFNPYFVEDSKTTYANCVQILH